MSTLEQAAAALGRGELVAAPTETLVGLLADARNAAAVDAVLRVKGRARIKTMGVLLPELDALTEVALVLAPRVEALARAHWPGPLTLIVPARPGLPTALTRDGTVAVRVPGPSLALELVRRFGRPVTATSANVSLHPAPRRTDDLDPAVRAACALVLEGEAPLGEPSTLLDVSVWPPRCVRLGSVPAHAWQASIAEAG